jgi:TonB family protein
MTRPAERWRLMLMMCASAAAHALIILGGLIQWHSADEMLEQHHVAVTLRPLPAAPPKPAASVPQPGQQRSAPAESDVNHRLTRERASDSSIPSTPRNSAPAEANPTDVEQEQPEQAALKIDDPVAPSYPDEALLRRLEGCVLAAVHVDEHGEVSEVRILEADVPLVFDQAVKESQMTAHYLPARQGGRNVPSQVLAVAEFVLSPGRSLDCPLRYAASAARLNASPLIKKGDQ